MNDCLPKQTLNVILLIDSSKSMSGKRISQVNQAIKDIQDFLVKFEQETINVEFALTLIPFGTTASYYQNQKYVKVNDFKYDGIKTGGWSNLHLSYQLLKDLLAKTSKGGIMPDFGGLAPIILLLTDGHPTGNQYKEELAKLENLSWFKAALRYGVAIELNDKKTIKVLESFVGKNGSVVNCLDSNKLKNIIKVIVITASKVKSNSVNVQMNLEGNGVNNVVVQQIDEALLDYEELEW